MFSLFSCFSLRKEPQVPQVSQVRVDPYIVGQHIANLRKLEREKAELQSLKEELAKLQELLKQEEMRFKRYDEDDY